MKKLETERFILRYINKSDINDIFNNYASDDEVTKYLTWPTHKSINDTMKVFDIWQKEDDNIKKYHYFIEYKLNHQIIGSVAVNSFIDGNPELGYVLGRNYWGLGIMSEACKLLIKVLQDDGYNKILINAEKDNIASLKVIDKCGFKFVKEDIVDVPLKNKKVMCKFFELIK